MSLPSGSLHSPRGLFPRAGGFSDLDLPLPLPPNRIRTTASGGLNPPTVSWLGAWPLAEYKGQVPPRTPTPAKAQPR